MSIDGKIEEGSMEIDTVNNLERFTTGSKNDEAVEIHDFQIVSLKKYFYLLLNTYNHSLNPVQYLCIYMNTIQLTRQNYFSPTMLITLLMLSQQWSMVVVESTSGITSCLLSRFSD